MYAIVKTGGKQYRVQEGQKLLVERLTAAEGESVSLTPLLYVNDAQVLDGDDLAKVHVEATVVAHERGPKLRVVKFKPKRGYKRRNGHRQELTRIEIKSIKTGAARAAKAKAAATDPAADAAGADAAGAAAVPAVSPADAGADQTKVEA